MGKYVKEAGKNFVVESPVGELEFVIVRGEGKLNTLNDKHYYQANLVLPADAPETKQFIEEINEVWLAKRAKRFSKSEPRSTGWSKHKVNTGEKDPDTDEIIYKETGNIVFAFKTETTYKDGKPKKVLIFNSKGREVEIGDKKIGNGSRGRIKGVVGYYEQPKEAGTTLYLNGVQLSKFVEYTGGVSFDEIEDEESDGFEGFDEDGMDALEDDKESTESEASPSRPRL